MRIHNVICGTICDRFLLYPYMREATLVIPRTPPKGSEVNKA